MTAEKQQITKIITEEKAHSIFTQKITRLCDLNVTPAPEDILGSVDYYKDDSKKDLKEGWLSRYYDFKNRHRTCKHEVPDYYEHYGDKYIRRFTEELYPKLSNKGKIWLLDARKLLQEYMEDGFEKNKTLLKFDTLSVIDRKMSFNITAENVESLELDNDGFRSFAYKTHPAAYIDAGLANLTPEDLFEIGLTPDFIDTLSLDGLEQIMFIGWNFLRFNPLIIVDTMAYSIPESWNRRDELIPRVYEYLIIKNQEFNEYMLEKGRGLVSSIRNFFGFP